MNQENEKALPVPNREKAADRAKVIAILNEHLYVRSYERYVRGVDDAVDALIADGLLGVISEAKETGDGTEEKMKRDRRIVERVLYDPLSRNADNSVRAAQIVMALNDHRQEAGDRRPTTNDPAPVGSNAAAVALAAEETGDETLMTEATGVMAFGGYDSDKGRDVFKRMFVALSGSVVALAVPETKHEHVGEFKRFDSEGYSIYVCGCGVHGVDVGPHSDYGHIVWGNEVAAVPSVGTETEGEAK